MKRQESHFKELYKKQHISSVNRHRHEALKKRLYDKYQAQEEALIEVRLKKQEELLDKKILNETRRQNHLAQYERLEQTKQSERL